MNLREKIISNAKKHNKKIVLPESYEERTLKAASWVLQNEVCRVVLIGKADKIREEAKKLGITNIDKAEIIDPDNYSKIPEYASVMAEIRKAKGCTIDEALKLLKNPLYLATMMVKMEDADGEVAGAMNATGDVLRPGFQFVKTMPGISVVSSSFIMKLDNESIGEKGLFLFADCAVNPLPNEQELAGIAVSTAKTARDLAGIEPRVAMLSFSTKGSAEHELVAKVRNATEIAKKLDPNLLIDGEFQLDAAIIESIGKKKAPGSQIAGKANVLIFPDLQSGNIGYKLVQRMAGAQTIGPILQGMAKPINDLSRGATVEEIVEVIAITANQSAGIS